MSIFETTTPKKSWNVLLACWFVPMPVPPVKSFWGAPKPSGASLPFASAGSFASACSTPPLVRRTVAENLVNLGNQLHALFGLILVIRILVRMPAHFLLFGFLSGCQRSACRR